MVFINVDTRVIFTSVQARVACGLGREAIPEQIRIQAIRIVVLDDEQPRFQGAVDVLSRSLPKLLSFPTGIMCWMQSTLLVILYVEGAS